VYQYFLNSSLIALLLSLTSLTSQAQNKTIDSLKLVISSTKGAEKFDATYELVFEYLAQQNYTTALDYLNNAETIANNTGDSLRMVKSGRLKAQVFRRLERVTEATQEYERLLPIARRNGFNKETMYILNGLGVVYTLQSNYDMALEYYFEDLSMREKEGNDPYIFETYNNIGFVYFKLKNYEKALEFYFKALQTDEENVSPTFKPKLYINIGLCYNQLFRYKEAQTYFEEGFKLCTPNCEIVTRISGEFGLGVCFYGQKQYTEAEQHFIESLKLSKETDDHRFQIENLIYLSRIHINTFKEELAIRELKEAEQLTKSTSYRLLMIEIYQSYANVYNQLKDFEKASFYQGNYIRLKDSVYNEDFIKNITRIQSTFEERDNIRKIAANEETIKRQRNFTFAIIVIVILALLLIFVLYRANKTKNKVNAALSEAKAQLAQANFFLNVDLQKAVESLRKANEELDNFIYKTSHDIRGPLASLKGMCHVAQLEVKDPVALDYLQKIDTTAEKLNKILTRLLMVNQINNVKQRKELVHFNEIVAEVFASERKKGLPQRFTFQSDIDQSLNFNSDPDLIRIIIENLVDNAIKFHSDSSRINPFAKVIIGTRDGAIRISVVDNGIGVQSANKEDLFHLFSRGSERSDTGGVGLYIIKTAAEKIGGRVSVGNTPEGHTEFAVTFQLKEEEVTEPANI